MSAFAPFSLALLLFAVIFLFVAAFLIFYALQKNEEVRAKFGHGKTTFELETRKRRDTPKSSSRRGRI